LEFFIFVVNAVMLLIVNQFVHGFHVDSFRERLLGRGPDQYRELAVERVLSRE
jgi:hypothetical protein